MRTPPDHVRVRDLIEPRRFTPEQRADYVRAHPWAPRSRPSGRGLALFRDAATLWAAVAAGLFPAPVRGPWGLAWPLDAVYRWRRHRPRN